MFRHVLDRFTVGAAAPKWYRLTLGNTKKPKTPRREMPAKVVVGMLATIFLFYATRFISPAAKDTSWEEGS